MKNKMLFSKTISFALILTLTCNLFPIPKVMAKETPKKSQEEEIEQEDAQEKVILWETIQINSVEDFLSFAENCSLDAWSLDKHVQLNTDIDLSDTDFDSVAIFTGMFDGKGHTISGYRYTGDGYVAGLFRYVGKNAAIQNLNVAGDLAASGEKECIGGLAGVNYGTLKNCSFRGTVSGKTTVGGLVGVNEGTGTIQDCRADGHIAGYYSTGGIVGTNHGSLLRCINRACVNNDSEWVQEDDEMGTGILLSIQLGESGTELFSGVDAGGIAGYSDGVVTGCKNYGVIGYEHTGYNIGGIAGRQCGILSLCENSGTVYGRKDIGGIVGQMEPYIEVNEAESLRNAVNKLHHLIAKTIDDMEAGKNAAKRDLDNLAAYSDKAADAGGALADRMADFTDNNMDQTQAVTDRLRNVTEMLPSIFDTVYRAQEGFSKANEALGKIGEELKNMGDPETAQNLADATEKLQKATEKVNNAMQDIQGSSSVTQKQLENLEQSLAELSDASYALMSLLNDIAGQQTGDSLNNIGGEIETAAGQLQSSADSLKTAVNSTRSIADYINGQPDIRFSKLGAEFNVDRESLRQQLKGMSQSLRSLNSDASNYSDVINDDLRAVNNQVNIVFNLLTDTLTNYEQVDIEDIYEDVDIEEVDNIASGKTDNCTNRGIVQGDINVGGIAGAMSIDEEDPEDNAAGNMNYQIGRKYFTSCVITNCVNEGYITAKKDGVGGIAGYMRHGTIVDSEGYGSVESTEGDFAGGICGESLTVIQHCYALCSVSGNKNIGGIAGYADTLKDCYSMADCTAAAGKKGAIAGQIVNYENTMNEDEVKVSGNYYVSDTLYGIDNISYAGIAEPILYEELLRTPELPAAFRHLKVIFRVEDSYLGEQEMAYGESLRSLSFPEIPKKEGCYGVWPDCSDQIMSGNLLITGEYREDVTVVQSAETGEAETAEGTKKPLALVEQRFTQDTALNVEISDTAPPQSVADKKHVVYDLSLENAKIGDSDRFAVRLYNPYDEKAEVWEYQDGIWRRLESKARGQYLQVDMTGAKQTFCVAEHSSDRLPAAPAAAGGAVLFFLLAALIKKAKKASARRKTEKEKEGRSS